MQLRRGNRGIKGRGCSVALLALASILVLLAVILMTSTRHGEDLTKESYRLIEEFSNLCGSSSSSSAEKKDGNSECPGFSPMSTPDVHARILHFLNTALKFDKVTDKIGMSSKHRYHNMYGQYLLPYAAHKPHFKMLEIGLGCNMKYGEGASVAIWKALFPQADLWEAEFVKKCVDAAIAKGQLDGISVLVGDQADFPTLDRWIATSGGQFDVIIDDGGHHNCQISNSFDKLWPQIVPGGLYFIEDLQVGKAPRFNGPECNNVRMHERILQWTEQLMFLTNTFGKKFEHKLPDDVLFVSCQAEACVIAKKKSAEINDPYKGVPDIYNNGPNY
jgi:hypothetical protein